MELPEGPRCRAPFQVLPIEAPVRVRSWDDGSWESGYRVVEHVLEAGEVVGYRVRRLHDVGDRAALVSVYDAVPDRRPPALAGAQPA